jgi:hypothetical protein
MHGMAGKTRMSSGPRADPDAGLVGTYKRGESAARDQGSRWEECLMSWAARFRVRQYLKGSSSSTPSRTVPPAADGSLLERAR